MSRKDRLLRILAALDGHFAADDCSPADADRWRELRRHITRIKDGLNLARIELESLERGAPQTKEIVGKALQHVRLGSARKPASAMGAAADGRPRRRLSHCNPTIAWARCTLSPRLASIYMRILDIIDTEEDLSAQALFDAVLDLLPVGEFPPINQPAELGWGRA